MTKGPAPRPITLLHLSETSGQELRPNGALLAGGSDEGSVQLWELASGRDLMRLQAHSSWV